MSAVATVEMAAKMSRALEDKATREHGFNLDGARAMISQKTGVSANTLANLRRDPPRLGEIAAAWVTQKLAGFMVRTLEEEIARAEHDLEVSRHLAARPDADEILAAQAVVAKARDAIRRIAPR